MNTSTKTHKLFHIILRVSKEDSVFTYFTLEANEGLCFYSTINSSLCETYRDIDIKGVFEFREEILRIIDRLRTLFPVEITYDDIISE